MKPPVPKSRRARIWLVTALAYLAFAVLVWFVGGWLAPHGSDRWWLRLGLWVLGAVSAGVLLWFFAGDSAGGSGGAPADGGDDLDSTLATATAHLASARAAGGRPLHSLPMVVFLGPEGSAKTTVIAHSGLEPDLLAGEVFRGDHIGPTPGVNLWYTHQTVLLEAGGKLAADPARWGRLVRRIRPRTLKATLTGRSQASRAAVVCFSCEELLKPGSAQAVPAAARGLRALLFRLAQESGVHLPVYVLFTKADRIAYFGEFTGRLSRDEAQQVLGVTQRWPGRATAGPYADREFQRLNAAFDRLMSSLAATRLELLARERDVERQAGLYEFPRELRKIVPATIQFLVELCRPSQLEVGPVLRGFYFTGVRAVVVSDAAPVAPAAGGGAAGAGRIAATQAFNAVAYEGAAVPSPAMATSRKMPQWLFLSTLFREVLLGDRAPSAVAQSARNVALLRRAGLAVAAALCVVGALWSTVQYVKNGRAISAARELAVVIPSGTDLPTVETLNRLETLRDHLERLSTWRRWWFYKGRGLYPELRQIYQERFNSILLGPARVALLKSLDSLPDAPNATAQYGRAYDLLKAYLMTTSQSDKLAARFVVPVLTERWINGRELDPARTELAQRQFEFYATRLCRSGACGTEPEQRVVLRTRRFLGQFQGAQRVYKLMVSEVSAKNPGIQFTRRFPAAAGLVTDSYEVPGAFTERGWVAMQDALKHIDRFFQADDWVLGDQQGGGLDRAKLAGDLRATYVDDYIRSWLTFLTAASVVPYQNPKDAARKLAQLGSNQSPLLQLLSLVAQNTKVDPATIGAAFQPVHTVMPPTATDRFVVDANQPYVGALNALQAVVEQTASAPGAAEGLMTQTLDAARGAKAAVGQVALKFAVSGEASGVGARVKSLLEEPVDRVERLMGRLPVSALNERGAAFCRSFGTILGKYPIKPDASVEATLAEVAGVFDPNNGALWRFYNEGLQSVLVKQGAQYVPKSGLSVSPTSAFVRFFNRLAAVTEALWPSGSTQPQFDFTLKLLPAEGVPTAAFSMDGQVRRFTRTYSAAQRYSWVGAGARDVRLSAEVRGRDETLLGYDGTWALFKLLQRARWGTIGVTSVVRWVVPVQGQAVGLEAELNLGAARPILKGDYFVGMSCVSQVVR